MGYGKRALQQLIMYYEGKMPNVGEDVRTEEHSMEISAEVMLQIFIPHQQDIRRKHPHVTFTVRTWGECLLTKNSTLFSP